MAAQIKHPGKVKLDAFLAKLRKAISPYIAEFKAFKKTDKGYWVSDYSGYKIRDNKVVQVDHIAPRSFRQLAYNYVKSRGIDIDSTPLLSSTEETQILENWIQFHNRNAKLQIVSKSQNKHLWLKSKSDDIHWKEFYTEHV
ncbi:hypothetical protein [Nostoc sp.]|uniref:hypothetical protein n=1 Tax=Nostoc sp. TaxID=1180 RepID=UPI002FFBEB91